MSWNQPSPGPYKNTKKLLRTLVPHSTPQKLFHKNSAVELILADIQNTYRSLIPGLAFNL